MWGCEGGPRCMNPHAGFMTTKPIIQFLCVACTCPAIIACLWQGATKKAYRDNRVSLCFIWWPRTELNCRHGDFQSPALPTELLGQKSVKRGIKPSNLPEVKACAGLRGKISGYPRLAEGFRTCRRIRVHRNPGCRVRFSGAESFQWAPLRPASGRRPAGSVGVAGDPRGGRTAGRP